MSPLVLDLDSDGVEVTQLGYGQTGSSVYFDMDNDGFAERTAWATGGDGLLAMDTNGNGMIDNQSELFGNTEIYTNGFDKLASLDTNADGKVTAADAQWNDLRVWVDADEDGVSDSGELYTLSDLGISEIGLTIVKPNYYYLNGNAVSEESSFIINGSKSTVSDVWFQHDQRDTQYLGEVSLDVRTLFLPTLRGFGHVKDLHIAMSENETLLNLVKDFATGWDISKFGTAELNTEISNILFTWAGVQDFYADIKLANNYGFYDSPYDPRIVAFMQEITGNPFDWSDLLQQSAQQMYMTVSGFYTLLHEFKSQLVIQVGGESLFSENPIYSFLTGEFDGGIFRLKL